MVVAARFTEDHPTDPNRHLFEHSVHGSAAPTLGICYLNEPVEGAAPLGAGIVGP
jgi:hypothetical protein